MANANRHQNNTHLSEYLTWLERRQFPLTPTLPANSELQIYSANSQLQAKFQRPLHYECISGKPRNPLWVDEISQRGSGMSRNQMIVVHLKFPSIHPYV